MSGKTYMHFNRRSIQHNFYVNVHENTQMLLKMGLTQNILMDTIWILRHDKSVLTDHANLDFGRLTSSFDFKFI